MSFPSLVFLLLPFVNSNSTFCSLFLFLSLSLSKRGFALCCVYRLFEIFLNKKLNITDFKYRKGVIGELNRSETRGDEDRTLFVQDFDPDVAEEILEKMKSVTVIGLTVKRCDVLPKLRLRDFSSSRGGGDRGDRNSFSRGGDRGDRNSFSRGEDRYNDRRGGSSRGGYERGEDRFSSSSRSRSYDDASPRRSWQSGR